MFEYAFLLAEYCKIKTEKLTVSSMKWIIYNWLFSVL